MGLWSAFGKLFSKVGLKTAAKSGTKLFSKFSFKGFAKIGLGAGVGALTLSAVFDNSATQSIAEFLTDTIGLDVSPTMIGALLVGGAAIVVVMIVFAILRRK